MANFCLGQELPSTPSPALGVQGFTGDNGLAVNAELFALAGLAVDGAGNIYKPGTGNSWIRKVAL